MILALAIDLNQQKKVAMTLYEYNKLNESEQYQTMWGHGVVVADRIKGEQKVILYQIFSFYVELYYHIEYNTLIRLKSFSGVEYLDVYIQQLDLKDIGFLTQR